MVTINTISQKYFSLDGIQYARIYQPLKQGLENIGIYSIFDTRKQIVNSTKYDEYLIDGLGYGNQALTIAALLEVVYLTPTGEITTDGKAKVSIADTVSNYLNNKISIAGRLLKSIINPGANEQIVITLPNEPNKWYLNTDGDDANNGSSEFPFETIQAAHDAASPGDIIIIQNSNFLQPVTPNTNITKDALTIRGVSSETNNQGRLRGTYNITGGLTLMIDLLSTIDVTFQGGSLYIVQLSNGYHDGVTSTTRNLKLIIKNALVYLNDPISLYSLDSYNSTANGDINSGRSGYFDSGSFYEGDWTGGIDATSNIVLHNSTIKGNVTQTGSLEKDNSVITGTEAVSGTTTDESQLRRRVAPTISANVLNIDFKSKNDYKTTAEVAASADFAITISNDSNADIATIDLFITNTVIITLPAGSIMEDTESRWIVDPTFELTIEGGTGESFELSLNKVGAKYKWVMSQKFI